MRTFVAAAVAGLAACSPSKQPPPQDAGADVALTAPEGGPQILVGPAGAHAFLPSALTIEAGTTVEWLWTSDGHTVTSGAEGVADGLFCSPGDANCDAGALSPIGTRYRHTFPTTGVFPYFCVPHYSVGMKATITVE